MRGVERRLAAPLATTSAADRRGAFDDSTVTLRIRQRRAVPTWLR